MRNIIKSFFTIFVVACLAGCATNNSELKELRIKAAMVAQQEANKPLFRVECPDSGCMFKSITIGNPNPKGLNIPKETNGWDFANRVVSAATTMAPWFVVSDIARAGIHSAGSVYNDSFNTTHESVSSVDSSVHDASSSLADHSTDTSSVNTQSTSNTDSGNSTSTDTSSVTTNTTTSTVNHSDSYNDSSSTTPASSTP